MCCILFAVYVVVPICASLLLFFFFFLFLFLGLTFYVDLTKRKEKKKERKKTKSKRGAVLCFVSSNKLKVYTLDRKSVV